MGFEKFGLVSYASQSRIANFVEYLDKGKIYGTRCKECGKLQFPPRAHCSKCLSTNFEWVPVLNQCVLITYTMVEAAPLSFIERAPYMLGLAQFTEGPKVFAWMDTAIAESEVSIGMKLRLRILQLSNGNLAYTLVKEAKVK